MLAKSFSAIRRSVPIAVLVVLFALPAAFASDARSEAARTGRISGKVIDAATQAPLVGAAIEVVGSQKGAAAETDGSFEITGLRIGSYTLRVRSIGYEPSTRTDVIVRAGRITFVEIPLQLAPTRVEGMVVSSSVFNDEPTSPTSSTSLTGEEIRRAPGSAGDVSRIFMSLPSVAKVNDQVNNLIVRGGNPVENAFYLDNIEIPNINHYPLFGTTGGPIGLLHTDFIKGATFSAGGFSSSFGNRLSSVMELEFREGNRDEFDAQLDLNFAGAGGIVEGPIAGGSGSYMFAARRSFLDLLVSSVGTGVVPIYSDYQGKAVYDLSPSNRISVLGVLGVDYIDFSLEDAINEKNPVYGPSDGYEYAAGINWRYLWHKNGFSNTSVSILGTHLTGTYRETKTASLENGIEGDLLIDQELDDRAVQLRNVNHYRFSPRHEVEFGGDVKHFFNEVDYFAGEYTSFIGDTIPSLHILEDVNATRAGGFVSYLLRPLPRLSTTFGVRYDYFEYTGRSHISPRFSFSYKLGENTSLNGATGIYYQTLPLLLLNQRDEFKDLDDPVAYHFVLGIDRMLSEDTKLTVESYYKTYDSFPMDPELPDLFVIDEVVYSFGFSNHEALVSDGKARSYGVEVTVQKKLVEGVYGLLSGTWFRSEYRGLDGVWRDRTFDNRFIFSAEGGYKPNEKWEYSLRWIIAGGTPYTPLDPVASGQIGRSVYDRTRINAERRDAYQSLNVRVDRRYNFSGSNMIVYFSIWNAYNKKNVAEYYWNWIENKEDVSYQWSLLPVFGIEFEF